MAAAFFPLAGLIGGAVDMTRIYITKTRLQQACDAGALAGRKVMAAGSWTTSGAESSRNRAYQMFAANFASGDFGTDGLSREFTEDEGTVTGVASADVPMTLMRIFGKDTQEVNVTCTAKMEIPNTDVMFVLDVTYSMAGSRMTGLKSAVKCFYEALLKVNTSEVCGGDPTATSYDGSAQIRLGFVPYAVNVNVGKLLPNAYLSDTWAYQSRQPNFQTVYAWSVGSLSSIDWDPWSSPPTLTSAGGYSGWGDISTSGGSSVSVNGTDRTKRPKQANGNNLSETACLALNTMGSGGNAMLDYVVLDDDLGSQSQSGTPSAPVHPATSQTVNYDQEHDYDLRGYRYRYVNSGDRCRLQQSNERTYTLDRSGSATRPVTWTEYQNFSNWTYTQRTLDVSGLKAGASNWNNSVSLANFGTTTGPTVKLSGSNSNTTLQIPGDVSVSWAGCIEERPTFQNTDGNPTDEWDPIPSQALDLEINHVPTAATPAQAWGPMLSDAVWGRYTGSSTRTTNNVTTSTNLNRNLSHWCPNPSRKLAQYNTVGDLETYVNSLDPVSLGTYHDIGLLWGARLISPVGIFGSENALTANGGAIERHMIFMTDGNAQTVVDNLYSHGLPWWDRRQTSYVPNTDHLDSLVETRLAAICTAVKNMNIQLWVISYGGGVDAFNEARLLACASPGRYYSASDGAALISRFKQIASEIADLRLTQ